MSRLGKSPLEGLTKVGLMPTSVVGIEAERKDIRDAPPPAMGHNSGAALLVADPRAQAALDAVFVDSHTDDPSLPDKKQLLVTHFVRLQENAARERDGYIESGFIFLELGKRLAPAEWRRFVTSRVLVPLGETAAYKLRRTVECMQARGVRREAMPLSWTLAHLLLTLDDKRFQQAMDAGLVRPSVTRPEVKAFLDRTRTMRPVPAGRSVAELERLRQERDEVAARQRNLLAELARLKRRLKLLNATIEAEAAG
jgi:hypothetical protein